MSYLRYLKLKYVLLFLRVLSRIDICPIRESRFSLRLSIFYFPQKEAHSNSVLLKMDSGKNSL